jgi:hypothetical protein
VLNSVVFLVPAVMITVQMLQPKGLRRAGAGLARG